MSEPGSQTADIGGSSSGAAVATLSSQLMIAAVIFLFMVVVFIFFLYLYAKHYMGSHPSLRRSGVRFIFTAADRIPLPRRGLDPELLKSLPVTIFRPNDFKDGLECAVCLSELSEGEEARLLPKCNHGFHVGCIDMWFQSHTTCPLCRAPVGSEPMGATSEAEPAESHDVEAVSGDGHPMELPNFPANVLFWGTQDHVSSRGPREGTSSSSGNPLGGSSSGKKPEGMLVIDIPRRGVEGFSPSLSPSPLPTSRFPVEDLKSPMEEMKSPMSAKFKSLRRLLSRGKRVIGSSCSPRGGDIEQGIVGTTSGEGSNLAPKTPTS